MKILRVFLLILTLLISIIPSPVSAENPEDAVISIVSADVYRNLVTTNDSLYLFFWNWSSGNYSTTLASEGVILTLADGNTTLASTTPYVFTSFNNSGYGYGVAGFYFLPSRNLTWQADYTFTIEGAPLVFTSTPTYSYTLLTSDYDNSTSQNDSRYALGNQTLSIASQLEHQYSQVLLRSNNILTPYGEAYFTAVVPGLRILAPQIFETSLGTPTLMPVQAYDTTLPDALTARIAGTDIHKGPTRLGAKIGVSGFVIWGVIAFVICLWVLIKTAKAGWPTEVGLFLCGTIMTGFALLVGDLIFTVIMIMAFLGIIGIAWALWGKRAG
jgi:hypothetical protein